MKFVFDLDGTLTRLETLPFIASQFGVVSDIQTLTKETIAGNIPFDESFKQRVEILSEIPVGEISDLLSSIDLFEELVSFINQRPEDCIIATGNLEHWVSKLARSFKCRILGSKAEILNGRIAKLVSISDKAKLVRKLKASGETVVFIGDGNNDSQAMQIADYSIAAGMVHWPAPSVLRVCDFAVFDESAMLRLLTCISNEYDCSTNQKTRLEHTQDTLVLSCAGMGTRLGLEATKALINFHKKPLIAWQLKAFESMSDIRIVVGFQAEEVIRAALKQRNDLIFVFNHNYAETNTGASLSLGAQFAGKYIIAWDGDLIVHKADISACIEAQDEYLGISNIKTHDGVYALISVDGAKVTGFSRTTRSDFEWSGPARILRKHLKPTAGHVFEGLLPHLPLPALKIRAFDIDTVSDYAYAKRKFREFVYEQ